MTGDLDQHAKRGHPIDGNESRLSGVVSLGLAVIMAVVLAGVAALLASRAPNSIRLVGLFWPIVGGVGGIAVAALFVPERIRFRSGIAGLTAVAIVVVGLGLSAVAPSAQPGKKLPFQPTAAQIDSMPAEVADFFREQISYENVSWTRVLRYLDGRLPQGKIAARSLLIWELVAALIGGIIASRLLLKPRSERAAPIETGVPAS